MRNIIRILIVINFVIEYTQSQLSTYTSVHKCTTIGCKICFNSTVCLLCDLSQHFVSKPVLNNCVCQQNYWFKNNQCKLCHLIIQNCENCVKLQSEIHCDLCDNNSYKSGQNYCLLCSTVIQQCLSCSNNSTCLSCQDEYFLNKGFCSYCNMDGCKKCENTTICLTCFQEYYLDHTLCKPCSSNCLQCADRFNCLICTSKYYIFQVQQNQKICKACPEDCLICLNENSCNKCLRNYYFDTSINQCLKCSNLAYCQGCNVNGRCTKCSSEEYYLNQGQCISCKGKNCLTCLGSLDNCTKCDKQYFPSHGKCLSCSEIQKGCLDCLTQIKCQKCSDGFYLQESKQHCYSCQAKFNLCITCSFLSCQKCVQNTYKNDGHCKFCNQTQTGCAVCSFQAQYFECQFCEKGFYLNDNKSCSPCQISNCADCSHSVCNSCISTHFLLNNTCIRCSKQFYQCSQCTASKCISCVSSFYLQEGKCIQCFNTIPNCLNCTSSIHCTKCFFDKYLTTDGVCEFCQSFDPQCGKCSSLNYCTQCSNKQYYPEVQSNISVCTPCDHYNEGCFLCQQQIKVDTYACTKCLDDRYFLYFGFCHLCLLFDAACARCTEKGFCNQCISKEYFLNNQMECVPCSPSMRYCQECESLGVCTKCQNQSYFLHQYYCQKCQKAIQNCEECSSGSKCLKCKNISYFLNDSYKCQVCLNVISHCNQCSSGDVCLTCEANYYVNVNHHCQSYCIDNCKQCSNYTECQVCNEGWQLNDAKQCQKIESNEPSSSNGLIIGLSIGGGISLIVSGILIIKYIKRKRIVESLLSQNEHDKETIPMQ